MAGGYATMEWLWDSNYIRVNLPGGEENLSNGSYKEMVETLGSLEKQSREVVSCVSDGILIATGRLFRTLKKK